MPGIMDTLKRLSLAERQRYARRLKQVRAFRVKLGAVVRDVGRSAVIALLWLFEAFLVSFFVATFQFIPEVLSARDWWLMFLWTLYCLLSAGTAWFLWSMLMPKKEVKP